LGYLDILLDYAFSLLPIILTLISYKSLRGHFLLIIDQNLFYHSFVENNLYLTEGYKLKTPCLKLLYLEQSVLYQFPDRILLEVSLLTQTFLMFELRGCFLMF